MAISLIHEMLGEYDEAVTAMEQVMNILKNDHGLTEGGCLDECQREIERLKKLCRK